GGSRVGRMPQKFGRHTCRRAGSGRIITRPTEGDSGKRGLARPAHDLLRSITKQVNSAKSLEDWPIVYKLTPQRAYKPSPKFIVIDLIVLTSCVVGVSNGPARELEGLSSAFAGLLSHCSLSGLVIQRKSDCRTEFTFLWPLFSHPVCRPC